MWLGPSKLGPSCPWTQTSWPFQSYIGYLYNDTLHNLVDKDLQAAFVHDSFLVCTYPSKKYSAQDLATQLVGPGTPRRYLLRLVAEGHDLLEEVQGDLKLIYIYIFKLLN